MARKEMRFRLIKDGEIVGYEWHINGEIHCKKTVKELFAAHAMSKSSKAQKLIHESIRHDSFELGIKVGDGWWFEGDIVENCYGMCTLFYDGFSFGFESVIGHKGYFDILMQKSSTRIGNIREEGGAGDNS